MSNTTLENTLKEMILREEFAPGERLTEAGLAERLGVSRTPVRNILPLLAAEGGPGRTRRRATCRSEWRARR